MRIIKIKTLEGYWLNYPECKEQLVVWYAEAKKANWDSPNALKVDYPSASIITNDRVVFNIKGNHYRLIVKINYKVKIIYIRYFGPHSAYDKIDASTI